MTAAVWIAISLAVVVVCLAIGIPYFLTHRRMADHYEHSKSEAYLEATGRTAEDVARGRRGRPWRSASQPGHGDRRPLAGTAADRGTGTEAV